MNQISPLAYVHPEAKLGDNNIIGPFCYIDKDTVLGDNNVLQNSVTINVGARIGNGNEIFPGASISTKPQDLKFRGEVTTCEVGDNFENDLHELIRRVIRKHKRIIFNGNGYGEEWLKEAERRGLLNLRTTPDCAHAYLDQKNVELFIRHSVYSEIELAARYKMKLDNYCKVLRIEAETMLHMLRRDILPAVSAYSAELANAAISKQELGIECSFEKDGAAHISRLISSCCDVARELDAAIADVSALPENYTRAVAGRDRAS